MLEVEAVRNDAGHSARRTAAAGDHPGKTEQAAPGQRRVPSQLRVVKPQQGKHILRKPVTGTRLEADVVAVLAPYTVQQAEQVVVEKVEEGRAYTDALRMFIGHLFQVVGGQWRIGAVQAQKRGNDAVAFLLSGHPLGFVHVRNREAQPWVAGQAHPPPGGFVWPTGFEVIAMQPVQPLQQLEEVVLMRLRQQLVG
ncbi:hypothetical protein D3C80_1328440 [compost metagenome]